ncbi:MAG: hypothetical protein ACKVP7_02965 [Hyphomicrobiaceae bacterium]
MILSEVLRGVDLLTSMGTLAHNSQAAIDREHPLRRPLKFAGTYDANVPANFCDVTVGQIADIRREVLQRLYINSPDINIAARHVEILGYLIHIGTSRVTLNGEQVNLSLPTVGGSVAWLPHDDDVLSRIVLHVHCIRNAAP